MAMHMTTEKMFGYFANHSVDQWLFQKPEMRDIYGIVLPVCAGVGVILNVLAFIIFRHKDMRGLSSALLKGNLIIDCCYLFTQVLLLTPKQWMYTLWESGEHGRFWKTLKDIQQIYRRVYPCSMIASLCSQWYSLALIVEQYYAFYDPARILPWMRQSRGVKLLVAILDLTILVHVTTFFKFILF